MVSLSDARGMRILENEWRGEVCVFEWLRTIGARRGGVEKGRGNLLRGS